MLQLIYFLAKNRVVDVAINICFVNFENISDKVVTIHKHINVKYETGELR